MERQDRSDPTEAFLRDVAEIRLRGAGRDRFLLRLGAVMMPLGIVFGIAGWITSNGTDNPLSQRDAIIIALIGATVSIVGVGLFLRYSLAEFLRFWMARLLHQQDVAARGRTADPSTDPTSKESRNP